MSELEALDIQFGFLVLAFLDELFEQLGEPELVNLEHRHEKFFEFLNFLCKRGLQRAFIG